MPNTDKFIRPGKPLPVVKPRVCSDRLGALAKAARGLKPNGEAIVIESSTDAKQRCALLTVILNRFTDNTYEWRCVGEWIRFYRVK